MNDELHNTDETAAELERLRQENEELKAAARLREAREAMKAELSGAGARSPELLFGAVRAEIEFDGEGRPANLGDLIARLRRDFPEQFEQAPPAGHIDAGSGTSAPAAQPLTAEALARMSPAEINRLDWAEVRSALTR